jgi:pilus assembly protein CpaF
MNGVRSLCLLKSNGQRQLMPPLFSNADLMLRSIQDFVHHQGLRLDPFCPGQGGTFSDDTVKEFRIRWHCVMPPVAFEAPLLSLRRHRFAQIALSQFAINPTNRERLEQWVARGRSLLITGLTGAGKTSLMVALLAQLPPEERVIILEQVSEIPCLGEAWIKLVAQGANFEGRGAFAMDRLLEEALRLRPDRMVLGEIRGGEAAVLVRTALTGHHGIMATVHARSASEAHLRLKNLMPPSGRADCVEALAMFATAVVERGSPPRIIEVDYPET